MIISSSRISEMDRLNNLRRLACAIIWLSLILIIAISTGEAELFRAKDIPQYYLNNATKLIHVDDTNQIGFLIGDSSYNVDQKQFASQIPRSEETLSRPIHKAEASNYSIYLISHNPKHIAILLDLIDIDFEPQKNCDNQELRFSVVSEIKEVLLSAKLQDESIAALEALQSESQPNESIAPSQVSSTSSKADDLPPMPVSEAMSILLNSPLNKSILETGGSNDFKLIDLTIDYLHADTCEHMSTLFVKDSNGTQSVDGQVVSPSITTTSTSTTSTTTTTTTTTTARPTAKSRRQPKRKPRPSNRKGQNHRNSTGSSTTIPKRNRKCDLRDPKFVNLISSRLDKYFTWDDFKVVCGNIKRLVIPMRSLKMSVYIDEFSPSSKFRIRYQFIEDPSELPAEDNGKYFCRNRNIIDLDLKCDGYDDCGDASDESVSVCGYPPIYYEVTKKVQTQDGSESSSSANRSHSGPKVASREDRRLNHYKAQLIDCCQPSDWIKQDNSQLNNLQSVIESMRLFSPPLFAPTILNDGDDSSSIHTESAPSSDPRRRVKRIVGGGIAQKGFWPSQASLQYEIIEPQCHFCAGTLIHPQYVLTAGHCVDRDGMSSGIRVVFGAHDLGQLGKHSPGIQVRYVEEAQQYPGVNAKLLDSDWNNDMNNDVALLRLNAPVVIMPHVIPACLPPFNSPPKVNTSCRSIGWGQTHGSGNSNLLKQLPLKVSPGTACSKELIDVETSARRINRSAYSRRTHSGKVVSGADKGDARFLDYDNKTMICVNNDLGHGICHGDSGGPLFCDRQTETGDTCTEMHGVASFIVQYSTVSAMCAVENLPGIFAEVSLKREWISSTMKMLEKLNKSKYSS